MKVRLYRAAFALATVLVAVDALGAGRKWG